MKRLFTVLFVAVLSVTAISSLHVIFATDNVVLTGIGLPHQSLGTNGDFYVDSATGNYYLKSNGDWLTSSKSSAFGVLQQVPTLKPVSNSTLSNTTIVNSQSGTLTNNVLPNSTLANTGSSIVNPQNILANGSSTNYVQPRTVYCFQGTLSVEGFCVDPQGHVLYSQPSPILQSNAGYNTLCSTGVINSQGLCANGVNSQGGILTLPNSNIHSNTHFCSTGLVNARGLCMNRINSENNIFPSTSSNPTLLSSNSYVAPYNTQSSFGTPDVTKSQILTIPGMNSPATMNSQGGLYGNN